MCIHNPDINNLSSITESNPKTADLPTTMQKSTDVCTSQPSRRLVDPCEVVLQPLIGEFLGTLFLTFLGAQLLMFASQNFMLTAVCTGLVRYILMQAFADCYAGEFNPAISLGRLLCFQQTLFMSVALIGGQFFGAFIGEILFVSLRPVTTQIFPFVFLNESEVFADKLPPSFQSYLLIEFVNTLLFTVTYLLTKHSACVAAVTVITMTLAHNVGLGTRATGNFAQIFARSMVATLWDASTNSWHYVEAAVTSSFIAPFLAAILYWLLRSVKSVQEEQVKSTK